MLFDCAEMADRQETTAMVHIGGCNMEMTDSVDTTDQTATLNSDASLPTSHSAQQDRKRNIGSSQELSSTLLQKVITKQDADLTISDVQTIEQSGTEMGSAETMQNLQGLGYKREHSHSPCSQTSPLQSPTSGCRAIGCVVEPEQELLVNGEASQGGQGEEKQPRKKVKREEMEGGGERGGGGNGRK